ncbi:MAG: hypothetical protein ACKVPX_06075 [Myxococcaceae bacterium]
MTRLASFKKRLMRLENSSAGPEVAVVCREANETKEAFARRVDAAQDSLRPSPSSVVIVLDRLIPD